MVTLVNRAKMDTATTGTGTITLGSAVAGYQTFAAAGVTDGQTVRYVIEDGTAWEIGSGVYTASGTTLSRSVLESSNSDNAISLSGTAVVFITAIAADITNTQTATTSSTSITTIANYATASFDAIKAVIVADDGTDRTASEILITWKSTTATSTEYAIINTGSAALATFTVDISGGNIRLRATAAAATTTNYTVKAITL
jgi:hypothetical protein